MTADDEAALRLQIERETASFEDLKRQFLAERRRRAS
jgi:hypothetical protein